MLLTIEKIPQNKELGSLGLMIYLLKHGKFTKPFIKNNLGMDASKIKSLTSGLAYSSLHILIPQKIIAQTMNFKESQVSKAATAAHKMIEEIANESPSFT